MKHLNFKLVCRGIGVGLIVLLGVLIVFRVPVVSFLFGFDVGLRVDSDDALDEPGGYRLAAGFIEYAGICATVLFLAVVFLLLSFKRGD